MLWSSYDPINLGMGFNLFDLHLTSGAYGTPGVCLLLCRPPFLDSVFFLGHASSQLGWIPWGEGFPLFLVIWFIPIHTKMSHLLGMGYPGSGQCKGCWLGGLCYVSKTLHMCTTLQQHCGTSLLHELS